MNYLPFMGYWFYGTASGSELASFRDTWGLLEISPTITMDTSYREQGMLAMMW